MSYIGQNLNVANSAPRASETQVGLTPYATPVEAFFGLEAGKAVTPHGLGATLSLYGVTQADRRQATAWVNFDGTGTVAIRDSYNVSSITDNGTGQYTVNFATPYANTNYAPFASGGQSSVNYGPFIRASTQGGSPVTKTTMALSVGYRADSTWDDPTDFYVVVFGGK